MNCQNFESIVGDLAREALLDASARGEALAHAGGCARCAARLADERALSGGLRSLAARGVRVEAPARVEAALLTAFRARAAAHAPTAATDEAGAAATLSGAATVSSRSGAASVSSSVPPVVFKRWSWPRTFGTAAAAAAAAVVAWFAVGLSGFEWRGGVRTPPAKARDEVRQVAATGGGAPSAPAEAATANVEANAAAAGPFAPSAVADDPVNVGEVVAVGGPSGRRAFAPRPVRVSAQPARYNAGRKPVAAPLETGGAELASAEITTDFFPLMHGGLAPGDGGQLIRVELPRSALISLGLPVNMERAGGGRVKADVLVGEDGMARAIRFVR